MAIDYAHDIKLTKDDSGIWDINFLDNGDLEVDDTFDINIIMSLFVDGRADSTEIAEPLYRRGFWADSFLFEVADDIVSGSKLWLVVGRNTQTQLNNAIDYCEQALEWLISKKYVKTINIDGAILIKGIILNIEFIIEDNSVLEFNFKLWENGVVEIITSL